MCDSYLMIALCVLSFLGGVVWYRGRSFGGVDNVPGQIIMRWAVLLIVFMVAAIWFAQWAQSLAIRFSTF